MANANPPKKNQAFAFTLMLEDAAIPGSFKVNPTIATGDFVVDTDGAGYGNVNAQAVTPAGAASVKITLSAAQMNGDIITVKAVDQTSPKEWSDWGCCILTTA